MNCSYCEKETDIIKSFPSETTSRICASCMEQVSLVDTNSLSYEKQLSPYIVGILFLAKEYVNEMRHTAIQELPESEHNNRYTKRDRIASYNRFRSLDTVAPTEWMPIKIDKQKTLISYGKYPKECVSFDGVHRYTLAVALNAPKIPVYFPTPSYKTIRKRQYQTLVLPDVILPGERPCDRWELLPASVIRGKRIIDLGCNSGMDGIMNCVLSDATYIGYDADPEAIQDGQAVAKLHGVENRCQFINARAETQDFPKADILWLFSAAKVVSFPPIKKAIEQSGCKVMFLETHNQHDDPDSQLILSLPYGWVELGRTVTVFGAKAVRSLYIATIP